MPKISTEQRQYYKSRIRSVIAQHPQISQVALTRTLESEGLKLDRKYLGSLLNDIYVERSKRANTWMLNQALSAFQDVMMEISAVASSIANDEFARKQDPAQRRWHSRSHGTQMLRQGDADVFKLYSQAKLGMMREALTKLDRRANERGISSTERAS